MYSIKIPKFLFVKTKFWLIIFIYTYEYIIGRLPNKKTMKSHI